MPIAWLSLAISCTVAYHLVLKLTPAGVNPLLSLLVTYALVTAIFGALLLSHAPADEGTGHAARTTRATSPDIGARATPAGMVRAGSRDAGRRPAGPLRGA